MGLILTALLAPALVGFPLLLARRLSASVAGALALGAAAVALVATIAALARGARVDEPWLPDLGVSLTFGADQISGPLLILTPAISVLVVLHGQRHLPPGGPPALYFGLLLIVETGALATFWTGDLVVFFVAFEIVLIPMWVLIHRFGDNHDPAARREAALRFVLFTALGSSLMLAGILGLLAQAGSSSMATVATVTIPSGTSLGLALLLVIGLGVKVPLFPLHSWLPPAHTIAPTGGSVLLAAILLKMGTYGLIRLPVALTPAGFARLAPVLAAFGVAGIVWGGLVCLIERDLKRLIAYSSVAHMGFVALALGTNSALGLQAALLANIAHGVIAALLFFVVGGLKERWGSVDLAVVRPALRETWPGLGFALITGLAGSVALPGLASFWGEFLALTAAWNPAYGTAAPYAVWGPAEAVGWFGDSPADAPGLVQPGSGWDAGWVAWVPPTGFLRTLTIVAAFGAVLAAAYSLRVARLVWAGDAAPRDRAGDLTWAEWVVATVLMLAIVTLGLVPYVVYPGVGS